MDAITLVNFYPKDPIIQNIMDRLMQKPAIKVNSNIANQFSKYKPIRYLRKKDKIFIGLDRRKDKSIILIDGITFNKKGNKYFFNGL